jgi:hypothetical protein
VATPLDGGAGREVVLALRGVPALEHAPTAIAMTIDNDAMTVDNDAAARPRILIGAITTAR